jgi:hypothetical protein
MAAVPGGGADIFMDERAMNKLAAARMAAGGGGDGDGDGGAGDDEEEGGVRTDHVRPDMR